MIATVKPVSVNKRGDTLSRALDQAALGAVAGVVMGLIAFLWSFFKR